MHVAKLLTIAASVAAVAGRVVYYSSPGHNGHNFSRLRLSLNNSASDGDPDDDEPFRLGPPASDQLWNRVSCKGDSFLYCMGLSDSEAARLNPPRTTLRNDFSNFPALFDTWGYRVQPCEEVSPDYLELDEEQWGIDRVLRELGVSDKATVDGGSVLVVCVEHGNRWDDDDENDSLEIREYVVDGRTYYKTGAIFAHGIDPVNGVIIAMHREGPSNSAKKIPDFPMDKLPDLRQASDIAWGLWEEFAGRPPFPAGTIKNIRYFIVVSITNMRTLEVISRALAEVQRTLIPWPGVVFSTETDQGKALMGTPNAVAFSFFLLQHKAELGLKYISSVAVFHCDTWYQYACLVYRVEDVPDPSSKL